MPISHQTTTRIKITIALAIMTTNCFGSNPPNSTYRKEGFTLGVLPAISYDSDLGFQYGGLSNLYWYGDGSEYPAYCHSLYLEASMYTAGSTLLRAYYDSPKLLTNIRTTIDFTWYKDQTMDFYGFNGYQAIYNKNFEESTSPDYITRVFYNHHREMTRFSSNFKGYINPSNQAFQWIAGFTFFHFNIGPVDISKLNKRKKEKDKLPDVPGLYDYYTEWGIINKTEKSGGNHLYLKAGLSYDTRDKETNPSKGVWSELFLTYNPVFFSSHKHHFTRISFVHRQYINLSRKKLIFAYRINLQHKCGGTIPFYLLPHITSSTLGSATSQGLGGAKTLRGIKRNRVVGNGTFMGNIEVRYKFMRTKLFKQDFYLATNIFSDIGTVTQAYNIDLSDVPEEDKSTFFRNNNDNIHLSYGLGLKAALNENFVVSTDLGFAQSEDDGTSGLYINLNYLF
ncbi:hypothetical protein DMA11_14555 [Marinilabiliaceae bacterium JC017]|nr:hypothetical protein DMA11_14555 [Marinilabiliaceae bacterium JC017]